MPYISHFLAAGLAVGAGATEANGSDFTSLELPVRDGVNSAIIDILFTRAAGSASLTLDYYFQISIDGGVTWMDYITLSIETARAVLSGTTVHVGMSVALSPATNIRLAKIVNNDVANALTAVNVGLIY